MINYFKQNKQNIKFTDFLVSFKHYVRQQFAEATCRVQYIYKYNEGKKSFIKKSVLRA